MPRLIIPELDLDIDSPTKRSLVDISEDHDMAIPLGCYAGHCAACMIRITQGAQSLATPTVFERYTLTEEELSDGVRLACQVDIGDEDLVIELY